MIAICGGPAAAAAAGCRSGHAFGDQVPGWPLRRAGRNRRGCRSRAGQAAASVAQRIRWRARSLRCLSGFARHQDAGAAHGAPLRQCAGHRAVSRWACAGGARVLPGPARPSGARACETADECLWWRGLLRDSWRVRRSRRVSQPAAVVRDCREPRRRGESCRAAGHHESLERADRRAARDGHRRQSDPPVRGHRGRS